LALAPPSELDCCVWLFHRVECHRVACARGRFGATREAHHTRGVACLRLIGSGKLLAVYVLSLAQLELCGRFESRNIFISRAFLREVRRRRHVPVQTVCQVTTFVQVLITHDLLVLIIQVLPHPKDAGCRASTACCFVEADEV